MRTSGMYRFIRALRVPSFAAMLAAAPLVVAPLVTAPLGHAVGSAKTAPCAGAQLDAGGTGSSDAAGTGVMTVRITNVSAVTCTLTGRPQLEFLSASGTPVVSQFGDTGPGAAFEMPELVVLGPGTSSGFVVTAADLLQPGAACAAVGSIRLHLVDQDTTFVVSPPPDSGWQLCGGRTHPSNVSAIVTEQTLDGYAEQSLPCTASGLVLSLSTPVKASGAAFVVARLADRYGELCTLDGYPQLSLTTTTGRSVVSFEPGRSVGTFPLPPLPRPVSMGAGRVAQFVFSAGDYQVVTNKPCPTARMLHLRLPDGSTIVERHTYNLCEAGGLGPFTGISGSP
jgi:hypothetical protein